VGSVTFRVPGMLQIPPEPPAWRNTGWLLARCLYLPSRGTSPPGLFPRLLLARPPHSIALVAKGELVKLSLKGK
jgi:hypothetical protein